MRKNIHRILAGFLTACLVSTNILTSWEVFAREQKDERVQNLRQLKTKTLYRDLKKWIQEKDASQTVKKLSAMKRSIKQNGKYRLLIRSSDSLDTVNGLFGAYDSQADIRKVWKDMYEVKVDTASDFGTQILASVENDQIPEKLLGSYEVIAPSPMESFQSTDYLSGEQLSNLWGITKIGADQYQAELHGLSKVKVGVIDSGIDATHTDLKDNADSADGYNFLSNDTNTADDNGHGTHVSGVIAAEVNGSGVFGVNSNAEIVPIKVLDNNAVGSSYDVLQAINYAVSKGVKVINLSLGGYGDPATDPICQAITDAKNVWVTTVVAAGNSNADVSGIVPAGCSDAITVGSVDQSGVKTSFSNYGNNVTVSAPGVDILSTWNDGTYKSLGGTSVSASFVAGAVSAMIAIDPTKTPDQIKAILKSDGNILNMDTLLASGSGMGNTGSNSNSGTTVNTISSTGSGTNSGSGLTLSGTTSSGTYLPPASQDPGLYYSGTFLYNGVQYGNSYYTGITFPDSVLKQYNVEVMSGKVNTSGVMTAYSAPTNGLVGEWLLDGNVNDTSGNGYNGTAGNVSWISAHNAQAGSFNGSSSQINFPSYTIPSWFQKMTIAGWIKNSGGWVIMQQGGYCPNGSYPFKGESYIFSINSSDKLSFITLWWGGNYTDPENIITSNWVVPRDDQWHHIVAIFDQWVMSLYIDNTKDAATTQFYSDGSSSRYLVPTSRFTQMAYSADYVHIWKGLHYCWYTPTDTDFFNGAIDNTRIYNRSLSSSEIQDLYNEWTVSNTTYSTTPTSLTNPVFANPLVKYDFSEASTQMHISNAKQQSNGPTAEKTTTNMADPITLSKGEFTYNNTLMSIPGNKIPYEFKLSYKNQLYYNGPTGINWDHNYNQYLTTETNGNVLYYNGQLGVFRFTANGGIFDYNEGLKANLFLSGSTYVIHYDNGDTYTFNSSSSGDSANKIAKIQDNNGNNLSFAYSGGLLSTVTDTLGRTITYGYYDHNRLRDVTDFNGRKVTMNYFTGSTDSGSLYDLQNVTINNGAGSTKTIGFEYSTGGTDTTNHAITKLIDAKGQTYVQNTYDSGGRVTSQKYGSGTLTYSYTLSGSRIVTNTVIDKLGHKTVYTYDANGNQTRVEYFNPAQTGSTVYTYEYNSLGYMTRETKPRGNGSAYSYDAKGNMTEKRMKANMSTADSSADLVTTYTYDSNNNVLTQTNPNNISIVNTYDSNNNLLSKTLSGATTYSGVVQNTTTNYTYLSGLLNTMTDGEGNTTQFQYSSGQISAIVRGSGSITNTGSFIYDLYGNPLASTDGEWFTKTALYNAFNLVGTGTTAEGVVTAYEYDANNNKTKETRYLSGSNAALGTVQSRFFYDLLDHMTGSLVDTASGTTLLTTLQYDENGNVTRKQVGSGALTKYSYNEFGKVTEERVVMNPSDSSKDIVTTYAYDTNGNLVSKTDPLGNVTTSTYDLYDRPIKTTDVKGTYTLLSLNKDGSIATKSVYDSGNTLLSKSAYLMDGLGNVTKSTDYLDPVNSTGSINTEITYDHNGKKTSVTSPHPGPLPGGEGVITRYTYDSLGRLSSSVDALGNIVSYSYDKRDLVIGKTITPNTGTGIITTTSVYDHDGRLTSETDNLNQAKTLAYNALGQIVWSTDEAGHHTDYVRNYLGKVTKETKYLSGGTNIITQYGYDERGNLTSVTDPNNNTTTYAYDGINRNTSTVYPDGKQIVSIYDKNGNIVSTTDPNGTIVTNTYDSLNHLTNRSIITGTGVLGVTNETYAYDSLGRPVSGTDSSGNALAFNYDPLGRLTSENNSGTVVGYTYDANGNRTSITTGTGYLANYTYDVLNRLTSVSYNSGTVANYSYSGILNTGISYGNGTNTIQTFDGLLRLSELNHTNASGSIALRTYSYDPVGNITSDGQRTYAYDTIDRLLNAVSASGVILPNPSESFAYDPAGNRTTANGSSYSGNILNQYIQISSPNIGEAGRGMTYDNNGNLVNNGTFAFSYDYKNRLVKVNSGSTVVSEYQYDILGRRIQKLTPTTRTNYIYAGENAIIETNTNLASSVNIETNRVYGNGTDDLLAYETDDSTLADTLQTEYLFCNVRVAPYQSDFLQYGWNGLVERCGSLASQHDATTRKMFYVHKDNLNSTIALTDGSGWIVQSYAYDVYGVPYVQTGTGFTAVKDFVGNLHGNDRLFTGREYEKELNLYYYRARFYDPVVGRFISRDPIGQLDNVDLYVYVGNNPLRFTDPTGKSAKALLNIFQDWYHTFMDPNKKLSQKYKDFVDNEWNGRFDLIYNKDFNNKYSMDWDINIWGKKYVLGEISNILVGFNARLVWMGSVGLWVPAMASVVYCEWNGLNCWNWVEWETADHQLYKVWRDLAEEVIANNGKITQEMLLSKIEEGVNSRATSLKNHSFIDTVNITSGEFGVGIVKSANYLKNKIDKWIDSMSNLVRQ